jgi:hypothetical protein
VKKTLVPLAFAAALLPSVAAARDFDYGDSDTLTFVAESSSYAVKFSWVDAVVVRPHDKYAELDGKFSWSLYDTTSAALFAKDDDVADSISGDYADAWRGSFSETFSSLTVGHRYRLSFRGEWDIGEGGWLSTAKEPSVSLAAAVPEPESYAMLLAGFGLIGTMVRRRGSRS